LVESGKVNADQHENYAQGKHCLKRPTARLDLWKASDPGEK
jgi:hypothetical protein